MKTEKKQKGPEGSVRNRMARGGGVLAITVLLAVTMWPPIAASNVFGCTLQDQGGNAMSGQTVRDTNLNTSSYVDVTTTSTGDCSTSTSSIGIQTYNIVQSSWTGATVTINNCALLYYLMTQNPWFGDSNQINKGYSNPSPGVAPTTLPGGKSTVDRDSAAKVTVTNGLGWHQVQGDGSPWGHFNVRADYQLTDNNQIGGANTDRVYRAHLQVKYFGYYDQNCTWHAVSGTADDNVYASSWTRYSDANRPYDSGVQTITFPLNGGALPLDAQKVGQGASDKAMKIEAWLYLDECDHTTLGINCAADGPLTFAAGWSYYVEP